ncbi:hypothetical protein ACF3NR_09440 [Vaginella massiliensis]|uniref:hypothetical protein n=1 Tax=Vaginella massiliensis TaxID=1816680 RepID=UPI003750028A
MAALYLVTLMRIELQHNLLRFFTVGRDDSERMPECLFRIVVFSTEQRSFEVELLKSVECKSLHDLVVVFRVVIFCQEISTEFKLLECIGFGKALSFFGRPEIQVGKTDDSAVFDSMNQSVKIF